MQVDYFDPHKRFLSLKVLWIVVSGFVSASIFLSVIIILNTDLKWLFSSYGFNTAISIFKVPLAILALIIPIIALLAANHRSSQTKELLKLSNDQNIFSNYYKHMEEFEKYCKEALNPRSSEVLMPRKLHKKVFPDAEKGKYEVSTEYLNLVEGFLKNILDVGVGFSSPENDVWLKATYEFSIFMKDFKSENGIDIKTSTSGSRMMYGTEGIVIPDGGYRSFIGQFEVMLVAINAICSFDSSYKPSSLMLLVLEYDFTKLPSENMKSTQSYVPFDMGSEIIKA